MTGAPNGPGASPGPARPSRAAGGLRRFTVPQRPAQAVAEEACELCGEKLGEQHPHMVDLQRRSIACACRACALLFTRPGGRYRTVPDRVRQDPRAPLTATEWAELQVPVAIAFFFVNSALGRVIACYPSPAGVTECELDLAAWDRLAGTHPLLAALTPDVEALLVVAGGSREAAAAEAAAAGSPSPETASPEIFLVPIDICYSLAGALRLEWHGFDGGAEVKRILADLLAGLRQRARTLAPAPAMTGPED
jgi:Family of unknown function (DUF5947)